ncbi:MAG: hypothetical protein V9G19_12600 [Tetrasphaera sp.]
MTRLLRSALLAGAVAAACACSAPGSAGGSDTPDPRSTRTTAPTSGSAPVQQLALRPDLDAAYAVTWPWRLVGDATLEFRGPAGPAACTAARVTLDEGSSQVTVRLEIGGIPGAGECAAIAEASRVEVPLSDPLGNRAVRVRP